MKTHVSKIMSCCFNSLRQIRSVWRSVSRPVLLSGLLCWECQPWWCIWSTTQSIRVSAQHSCVVAVWWSEERPHLSSTTRPLCTGCEFQTAPSSIWPFSSFIVVTTLDPHTCQEACTGLLTVTHRDDFSRHHLISWWHLNKTEDSRRSCPWCCGSSYMKRSSMHLVSTCCPYSF